MRTNNTLPGGHPVTCRAGSVDLAHPAFDFPPVKDLGTNIVILDAGFVYVGQCVMAEGFLLISNARCIRRWGTTKGLGELRDGPTKETQIDEPCELAAPIGKVNHIIKCTRDW